MTSTRKGGEGVLKFVTWLRILLFLNNRSIEDGGGRRVKKLVIFCGSHKWMTPLYVLKITKQYHYISLTVLYIK